MKQLQLHVNTNFILTFNFFFNTSRQIISKCLDTYCTDNINEKYQIFEKKININTGG